MNKDDQELIEMMLQLENLMHREILGHLHKSRTHMSPHRGQGRIMSLLKQEPEISQKELGLSLDMSKQGLAELLSKLELAGYLNRTPSKEDGRAMMIRLTETGKKAAAEMSAEDGYYDSVFSCLMVEEKENLKEYLKKMIQKAQEHVPERFSNHHRRRNGFLTNGERKTGRGE